MVEQWTHKPLVGGSNPPFAIFTLNVLMPVSQLHIILEQKGLTLFLDSEPVSLVVVESRVFKPLKDLDAIESVYKPVIFAGEVDDFV
jgi:hypothetical protein